MQDAVRLPPIQAIVDLHDQLLTEHGGVPGLRDRGGLDSALARPLQLAAYAEEPLDLPAFATALCGGICRIHHPFADGNKRAAFAALGVTLLLNGAYLDAPESEAADRVLRLADGTLDEAIFAAWLRLPLLDDRISVG